MSNEEPAQEPAPLVGWFSVKFAVRFPVIGSAWTTTVSSLSVLGSYTSTVPLVICHERPAAPGRVSVTKNRAGDVLAAAETADWYGLGERRGALAAGRDHLPEHLGVLDRTGRHHVHRDAVGRKFQGPGARHADHACLGCGIYGAARQAENRAARVSSLTCCWGRSSSWWSAA